MSPSNGQNNPRRGRSTPSTPSSDRTSAATPDNEDAIHEIAPQGDLVIEFKHLIDRNSTSRRFRVSSSALRSNSRYFESLLQPGRFSEAATIKEKHEAIREQYGDIAKAPSEELPVLHIEDLGRISVKSIGPLLNDFLSVVHGKDTQTNPPVANLANLAIVADRFDALDVVAQYAHRKRMFRALDGKTTAEADSELGEERVRQRLLVAILLDDAPWVEKYSIRLIMKGWVGKEVSISSALWWDIPRRIEEELTYRRECILDTVQSLQQHFLALYTSRQRQCKLGYDSSVSDVANTVQRPDMC
jgi:hypothetical protein